MMMLIRSNLKALADERSVSIREIARAIDYRYDSVRLMYNDEMERYPRDLLSKLCLYFGVAVDDLLTLTPAEASPPPLR